MRKPIALTGCLVAGVALQAADPNYQEVKEIPIGGATKIVVADTDTGKIVGEIPDTPGVHGFAIASSIGRGFTSNGRANSSTIVDLKTLTLLRLTIQQCIASTCGDDHTRAEWPRRDRAGHDEGALVLERR